MYPPSTYPPSPGPIGFILPQKAVPEPSAPPIEGGVSAPSKKEMAENEFVIVGSGMVTLFEIYL